MTDLRARQSPRDERLDFWRGLCLIDMVIVHMVRSGMGFGPVAYEVLSDYTRFAAGGYVLLSGMTVGFVFYPRVIEGGRRWESYRRLWRRAGVILLVHILVTLAELMILGPSRGDPFPNILTSLRDILMFREGYDLLPFYMFMVLLSPLVLELMRRRRGWVVALASVGLFVWMHLDHNFDWASFKITNTFFFGFWQLVFILGIFGGSVLRRYDALPASTKRRVAGGFWLASVVIFFAAYGHHFGLQKYGLGQKVMDDHPLSPLTFWKTPLTVGELLRYTCLVGAIVTTTDLAWHWVRNGWLAAAVNRMGRRSLAIYLVQGYLIAPIDRAWDRIGGPWGMQFLWMLYLLALLWSIAWIMDVLKAARQRLLRPASQSEPLPVTS